MGEVWQPWTEWLKRSLGQADASETDDEPLLFALAAAWGLIEEHTRRALVLDTRTEVFYGPWQTLWLPAYPVRDLVSVEADGKPVEVRLDAERGMLRSAEGMVYADTTTVMYQAGYPPDAIPMPIAQACVLIAAALHKAEEHGGKLLTGERLGDYQVQFAAGTDYGPMALSPAAFTLLGPYVRPLL